MQSQISILKKVEPVPFFENLEERPILVDAWTQWEDNIWATTAAQIMVSKKVDSVPQSPKKGSDFSLMNAVPAVGVKGLTRKGGFSGKEFPEVELPATPVGRAGSGKEYSICTPTTRSAVLASALEQDLLQETKEKLVAGSPPVKKKRIPVYERLFAIATARKERRIANEARLKLPETIPKLSVPCGVKPVIAAARCVKMATPPRDLKELPQQDTSETNANLSVPINSTRVEPVVAVPRYVTVGMPPRTLEKQPQPQTSETNPNLGVPVDSTSVKPAVARYVTVAMPPRDLKEQSQQRTSNTNPNLSLPAKSTKLKRVVAVAKHVREATPPRVLEKQPKQKIPVPKLTPKKQFEVSKAVIPINTNSTNISRAAIAKRKWVELQEKARQSKEEAKKPRCVRPSARRSSQRSAKIVSASEQSMADCPPVPPQPQCWIRRMTSFSQDMNLMISGGNQVEEVIHRRV